MIRKLLRRCAYRGCWKAREVDVEMIVPGPNPRTIRESFCAAHADEVMNKVLPSAHTVKSWDEGGNYAEMHDRETAARMLAIGRGIGMREARRELERQRKHG